MQLRDHRSPGRDELIDCSRGEVRISNLSKDLQQFEDQQNVEVFSVDLVFDLRARTSVDVRIIISENHSLSPVILH